MKYSVIKCLLLILFSVVILSFRVPPEWHNTGSAANKYAMGVDSTIASNTFTIQSSYKHIHGYGTLMQYYSADAYSGKRIKMSGMMKSINVKKRAGFWMQVQPIDSSTPVAFDNMHRRPVKGSTNWQRYEIVLDVPEDVDYIAMGALLSGTGKIWFKDINIEVVSTSTPTTGKLYSRQSNADLPCCADIWRRRNP